MGGMPDITTGRDGGPDGFRVVHGLDMADGPSVLLQVFRDSFPLLHLEEFCRRMLSEGNPENWGDSGNSFTVRNDLGILLSKDGTL